MQVKRIEAPVAAQGSVFDPVGCFLVDGPRVAAEFTVPEDGTPTVLVALPVSLSLLEAACLGPTGVSLADLGAWTDDEFRVWALMEAFGVGTCAAMDRLPAPFGNGPDYDLSVEPSATFARVLRARLCRAFGFPAAGAGDVDQDVTVPVPAQGPRVGSAA